jgi:hypothetical protein
MIRWPQHGYRTGCCAKTALDNRHALHGKLLERYSDIARTIHWLLRGCFVGCCVVIRRTLSECCPSIARSIQRILRWKIAGTISDIARLLLGRFIGCCVADSLGAALDAAFNAALRMSKGMVSNQITGFSISESRHKSRSIERSKNELQTK